MASAYSFDLRKKALEIFEEKKSKLATAKILKISVATIFRWVKQNERTGSVAAKKGYQKGYGHKIKDLEKFKNFVDKNNSFTIIEMSEKLKISKSVVHRALHKIGYTVKKNNFYIKSDRKNKFKNIWIKQRPY